MALSRQINDRQPAESEGHAGIGLGPRAFVIRAAVSDPGAHRLRDRLQSFSA